VSIQTWSWIFLAVYIGVMIALGALASRKIAGADDFATARRGYTAFPLALAFASTAASGATFLGLPGLVYTHGLGVMWIAVAYPLGIYTGILICQRMIARLGNDVEARSIPEFLGEKYQSEALRLIASIFSLILLFYLAGQLVSGLVMFEMFLGLDKIWAMALTTLVLAAYVFLGGAHADILTDGAQGLLMLVLAVAVFVIFIIGAGAGGFNDMIDALRARDPLLIASLREDTPLIGSAWSIFAVFFAHIPLGLLPHIGNKLWALKTERARTRFLVLAAVFGFTLPMISLGGAVARAVLGDDLFAAAGGANGALPALFIKLFPAWLAALLGVGVLAAVMSTADGLVISTSQVFANDIYRRSIAPRIHPHLDPAALDRRVLHFGRIGSVATLAGTAILAWVTMDMNVVLLVWAGVGGFTAALMGPMVLGALWPGVTRAGALAGFISGAGAFIVLHSGILPLASLAETALSGFAEWLLLQQGNPYTASTLGGAISLAATAAVSVSTLRNRESVELA
jgi:Na+/proline symporter